MTPLDLAWHVGEDQACQIYLAAGVIDINADESAVGIVVQDDSL